MKRMIIALVAMFMMTFTTASAMSYEQARQQALFLTDKMAYELNLTDDQYEAAYEVNLDYLMSIDNYDDLYGSYWRQRNMDLSYILLDWQYQAYLNASYFYRPLYWSAGYWHFGIYARYPRRDYFFFGRPHFYVSYRGGHSWRVNGGRSWYHGRQFGGPRPGGNPRIGMRDGFNRGDFGRGRTLGNPQRQSSTRTTVTRPGRDLGNGGNRPNNGNQGFNNRNDRPNNSNQGFNNRNERPNNGSFGGRRTFGNGSFSNSNRPSNGEFAPRSTTPSSSFGSGNRSFNNSGNRSFNNNGSNRSFNKGGSSNNSRSFGGGSRSNGGSHSNGGGNNGGGHFGGRR